MIEQDLETQLRDGGVERNSAFTCYILTALLGTAKILWFEIKSGRPLEPSRERGCPTGTALILFVYFVCTVYVTVMSET
jgi:hypothetical protein